MEYKIRTGEEGKKWLFLHNQTKWGFPWSMPTSQKFQFWESSWHKMSVDNRMPGDSSRCFMSGKSMIAIFLAHKSLVNVVYTLFSSIKVPVWGSIIFHTKSPWNKAITQTSLPSALFPANYSSSENTVNLTLSDTSTSGAHTGMDRG